MGWKVCSVGLDEGIARGFARADFDDGAWAPAVFPFEFQLHGLPPRGWFRGRLDGLHRITGCDSRATVWADGKVVARLQGPYDACTAQGAVAVFVEEEPERVDWVTGLLRPFAHSDIYGWKRTVRGVHGNWDCKRPDLHSGGWWRAPEPEPRVRVFTRGRDTVVVRGEGELVVRAGGVERRGRDEVVVQLVPPPRPWSTWDRDGPSLVPVEVNGITHEVGFRALALRVTPGWRDIAADFLSYLDAVVLRRGLPRIAHSPDLWRLRLNGEELFLRGINYISDLHPSCAGDFERDIALLREANLNFVRVHGHVEPPEFYAACSRAGILVMQDLPLQWGYSPSIRAAAARAARHVVEDLRGHTCLAVWNVHNEPMPWDLFVLDRMLISLVKRLDPGRAVIAGTAYPGVTHHVYAGWYWGAVSDFRFTCPAACTELGAQSLPMEGDGMTCAQTELLEKYVGPWRDGAELRASSQEYQAIVMQIGIEHYRRLKPECRMIAPFLFADGNPAVTWSVLDHGRVPKPAFAVTARSMQPVLASLERYEWRVRPGERIGGRVFLVNDGRGAREVTVEVRAGGERKEFRAVAAPDRAVAVGEAWFAAGGPGRQVIELVVRAGGEVVSRNEAWYRVGAGGVGEK